MSFSVERLGLGVLTKICLLDDEKSLLNLSATCKTFNKLIFSYPCPKAIGNEGHEISQNQKLKNWENREFSSREIWNNCFQKTYKKTINQMLIVLSRNLAPKEYNLLLEIIQSDKKMPKYLNINTFLNPQNEYERIKCCFFNLKLDSSSKHLAKKFKDFKNTSLYTSLIFSIPSKNLHDKLCLLLFETDYEIFQKTGNKKILNRWQWVLFLPSHGNRRITAQQLMHNFQ